MIVLRKQFLQLKNSTTLNVLFCNFYFGFFCLVSSIYSSSSSVLATAEFLVSQFVVPLLLSQHPLCPELFTYCFTLTYQWSLSAILLVMFILAGDFDTLVSMASDLRN